LVKNPARWIPALLIAVLGSNAVSASHGNAGATIMSVAWSSDSDDVWVAWNYGNQEKTEAIAVKECTKAMSQPCQVASTLSAGVAVLQRQQNGIPYLSYGPDIQAALSANREQCSTAGTACALLKVLFVHDGNPGPHLYQPMDNSRLRKKYGAVVVASSAVKNRRIHIASGRSDAQTAINDALANCKGEGGIDCKMIQWGGNTKILVASSSKGDVFALGGDYPEQLRANLNAYCTEQSVTCTVQTLVDSRLEETSFYSP
jgi:Domain of unknown function (DUF4189)